MPTPHALETTWRTLVVAVGAIVIVMSCSTATPEDDSGWTPAVATASAARDTATAAPSSPRRRQPKRVVNVPASIDSTGATAVSSKLQAFIDDAPDGSTIVFKAGGRYKLDKTIRISGRKNLTLEGNGARLDLPTADAGYDAQGFQVRSGSVGTTIRGFTMVGNNSEAGTSDACCSREAQHAIAVLSANDTLIEDVDISRTWGDCVYVNAATVPGGAWSDGVTFRNSTCRLTGRHGVGIIRAKDVRIVNNHFDEIGFDVVDIEPGAADAGADGVVIRGNDIDSYGLGDQDNAWLLAACGKPGSDVRNVTVTGNDIEGNRIGWSGNVSQPWRALSIRVCGDSATRANFKVTDNVARNAVSGPAMYFTSVQGVTVTGNEQPLSSGTQLASFSGSSNVTYDG